MKKTTAFSGGVNVLDVGGPEWLDGILTAAFVAVLLLGVYQSCQIVHGAYEAAIEHVADRAAGKVAYRGYCIVRTDK